MNVNRMLILFMHSDRWRPYKKTARIRANRNGEKFLIIPKVYLETNLKVSKFALERKRPQISYKYLYN